MSEDAEVSEGNEMNGNDMQDGQLKSEKGSAGTLYKQEKWFVSAKRADFNAWGQKFGISPILARIIRNRDVAEEKDVEKYLYGTLEDCYSPWLLKDMDRAVRVILDFIDRRQPVRVMGDYDVDGICSSYILTRGLRALGGVVDTAIPHRIHDGYGLNDHLIEEAKKDGVRLIVTCDNGIAAADQIRLAGEMGITVVVTDHHEVPFRMEEGRKYELLPPAAAVVDPKQEACTYPYKNICGGVVAYKLLQALLEEEKRRREQGREEQSSLEQGRKELPAEGLLEELLEFAALATVCDVMELKDENRILVKEGLKRLAHTKNLGLRALMEVNGLDASRLSAYHLGFVIGPCLNATGRLDTASRALELLQSGTKAEAISAASELKELNDSRKNLTLQGVKQAQEYLEENHLEKDPVLVVFLPMVHESLAGIIAGRIREKYNHPVFVLTQGEEGVKGSGRSIEAYHMYEHMVRISSCFAKFGGHKLAAGLTLAHLFDTAAEDVEHFRMELNRDAGLREEDFIPQVHIDIPMPVTYGDMMLARELERLEPYGVGNPKPLFAHKDLHFIRGWLMGAKHNFARFRVCTAEGQEAELVFFGDLERFHEFLDARFGIGSRERLYETACDYVISVTYQLSVNVYRGSESLQIIMQNYC